MKLRDPGTVAGAVHRITGALTIPASAELVGRAPRTVATWGDDDADTQIPVDAAIKLDAAYVAATGETPPIFEHYKRQLADAIGADLVAAADDPIRELLGVTAADGDLAKIMARITAATSKGGAGITPAEMRVALNQSAELRRHLDDFDKALRRAGGRGGEVSGALGKIAVGFLLGLGFALAVLEAPVPADELPPGAVGDRFVDATLSALRIERGGLARAERTETRGRRP